MDAHLELATTRRDVDLDEPWAHLHRQRMEGGVRDMYRRAGVVGLALHPSTRGSGSTVVLEAAASARPVVATRTPAMEALIADGERGLLVEPGNADAMADALATLLADPERARRWARPHAAGWNGSAPAPSWPPTSATPCDGPSITITESNLRATLCPDRVIAS